MVLLRGSETLLLWGVFRPLFAGDLDKCCYCLVMLTSSYGLLSLIMR